MIKVVGALLAGLVLPLTVALPAHAAATGVLDIAVVKCTGHAEGTVLRVGPVAGSAGACSTGPGELRIALADGSLVGVAVDEKGLRYVVLPAGRATVIDPESGKRAAVVIAAGRHSGLTVTKYGPISVGGAVPPQNPTPAIPRPPDTTIRPASAPATTTGAAAAGPAFASSVPSTRPLADAANSDSGPGVALIGWLVAGFLVVLIAGGVVVARSGRARRG